VPDGERALYRFRRQLQDEAARGRLRLKTNGELS
jgi:hypothetical protein